MKKVFAVVLLLASAQSFASVHAVSRTLKTSAKVASYPVRHPFKSVKAVAHGVYAVGKAVI